MHVQSIITSLWCPLYRSSSTASLEKQCIWSEGSIAINFLVQIFIKSHLFYFYLRSFVGSLSEFSSTVHVCEQWAVSVKRRRWESILLARNCSGPLSAPNVTVISKRMLCAIRLLTCIQNLRDFRIASSMQMAAVNVKRKQQLTWRYEILGYSIANVTQKYTSIVLNILSQPMRSLARILPFDPRQAGACPVHT